MVDDLETSENEELDAALPEAEYPTLADTGLEAGPQALNIEPEWDAEPTSPETVATGAQENSGKPPAPAAGRGRKKSRKKMGRPRIDDNIVGLLTRKDLTEIHIHEYILARTKDLVDELGKGEPISAAQQVTLVATMSTLSGILTMNEVATKDPSLWANTDWLARLATLTSLYQKNLKMLGLYTAPKTKPDRKPRPDVDALLEQVKAKHRKRA